MTKKIIFSFFLCALYSLNIQLASAQPVQPSDSVRKVQEESVSWVERIENFAKKDNVIAKLVRSVWVFDQTGVPADTTRASYKPYEKYNGKIIRKINVEVLDPFGYNINRPVCKQINWFQRTGNYLHYTTRPWVIKERLLFSQGDTIRAFKISESERLLRQNPSVLDARIVVVPADSSKDSVDVLVIAQDVWTIGSALTGDHVHQSGSFSLDESNFIGLGHKFENRVWYNPDYYNHWQYNGRYLVPEIANTFISAEAFYRTQDLDRWYGVNFQRPFISPSIHWAGGLSLQTGRYHFAIIPANDTLLYTGYHKISNQDVWLGYAFNPRLRSTGMREKSQILFSTRVIHTQYLDKEFYTDAIKNLFYDRTIYLASIGYSFRKYYKDRYIFGFGRTEDIPVGYLVAITGGFDDHGPVQRPYAGMKTGFGTNNSSLGYMSLSLETGGFLHNQKIEEAVISSQLLFFTNMLRIGRWQIRQFLWDRIDYGINRPAGEHVDINQDGGLRGFSTSKLMGTRKWVNNYEFDLFTPYKPLGFRMVFVLFADYAMIGSGEHPLLKSRLYQGYGIGMRFKNERLIFKTVQLSFHYYPEVRLLDAKEYNFLETQHMFYRFEGFQFSQPYFAPL